MVKKSTLFTTTSTVKTLSSLTGNDFSCFVLVYKNVFQIRNRNTCSGNEVLPDGQRCLTRCA